MTDAAPAGDTGWWRRFGTPALNPPLLAAIDCFVAHGYHGTTTRELAAAAGLSVPGLYHHHASKQAMLVDLMEFAMDDLYRRSLAALDEAGPSPVDQMRLHVECQVLFHAHRGSLAFLAAAEIRGLEPDARARHLAARDRQQRILDRIVDDGTLTGDFITDEPRTTSRAIVTICTAVAQWYRLGGPFSPDDVAGRYIVLAERMLGRLGPA